MKLRPSNEAREQADLQLHRTLMIMLVGVFLVVLVWISLLLTPPRFEPIVRLPYTSIDNKAPERECQRTVTIRADGDVFLADERVALTDLESALRRYLRDARCEEILRLRIDGSAKFGTVRHVIQAAQTARVPRVTVLARPHDDPGFHY
jgi:biopolymer transport protein ExbD